MTYQKTPSPAEVEAFFGSIEARDNRRAAHAAMRSLDPRYLGQGRTREERPEFMAAKPRPLFEPALVYLGDKLRLLPEPTGSKFNRAYRIPLNAKIHVRYVGVGKSRNSEMAKAAAAKDGDETRFERQREHVADSAQRESRDNARTALLRRAALLSVYEVIQTGQPFVGSSAVYAADAIFDFADSMRSLPSAWQRQRFEPELADHIEHVGTYAGNTDPEVLRENPALILLVGTEQTKRFGYWSARNDLAVRTDGEERIAADEIALRDDIIAGVMSFGIDESRIPAFA